jgi:hypothetical protein
MISIEQAILNLAVALGLSAAIGFAADSSFYRCYRLCRPSP